MSVRAIAATGEVALAAETYVSSALAVQVQLQLPKINDASGITVAVGKVYRIEATGAGPIQVLTFKGRLAGVVPARSAAVFVAKTGTVQAEEDVWNVFLSHAAPSATTAAAPAGGAGAAAGAYDTAGNRDIMIATVNAMRTCLINAGFLKAE